MTGAIAVRRGEYPRPAFRLKAGQRTRASGFRLKAGQRTRASRFRLKAGQRTLTWLGYVVPPLGGMPWFETQPRQIKRTAYNKAYVHVARLSPEQRVDLLKQRITARVPWHSPSRLGRAAPTDWYHLTAACYEHQSYIGRTTDRLEGFTTSLLQVCDDSDAQLGAWSVLPNHYHLLVHCVDLRQMLQSLGRVHGRSSHAWNIEENARGRTVFHGVADRSIKSERHWWVTLNYIHHNPVKHGYVDSWTAWRWSSAASYLDRVGRAEAVRIWRSFPLLEFGAKWDV